MPLLRVLFPRQLVRIQSILFHFFSLPRTQRCGKVSLTVPLETQPADLPRRAFEIFFPIPRKITRRTSVFFQKRHIRRGKLASTAIDTTRQLPHSPYNLRTPYTVQVMPYPPPSRNPSRPEVTPNIDHQSPLALFFFSETKIDKR